MFHVKHFVLKTFVPVRPSPKGRPRINIKTGRVYTPKSTREAEKKIKAHLKYAMILNSLIATESPLKLDLIFCYSRKSAKNKFGYRVGRPDLDNLIKILLDSANGIVYVDDAQVVEIHATKVYDEMEGIYLSIEEIADGNLHARSD